MFYSVYGGYGRYIESMQKRRGESGREREWESVRERERERERERDSDCQWERKREIEKGAEECQKVRGLRREERGRE